MKKGLVMEGGAMRGMFTAGVMDVLMENNIKFDGAVGTSAGAVFGCNYKSHQIGRVIRYNKKYCRDKRYGSLWSLLTTGNIFGVEFAYHLLPEVLDPFDNEAYEGSPMEFYVTCTDVETGKAVYKKCETARGDDLEWMRASASLPLAADVVEVEGRKLSDGGTADSIPIKFFEKLGYDKNVVVLTREKGYEMGKNKMMPVIKLFYRKYPAFVKAIENRYKIYNSTVSYIEEQEKAGRIFVIRPEAPLNIGKTEKKPDELERVYQEGRRICTARLSELTDFFAE